MSKTYFSENEDDPPVYESSGSEWNSSSELETVRKGPRRKSTRASKKARLKSETSSDSEYEKPKSRKRNGVNKKLKVSSESSTPEPTKVVTKTPTPANHAKMYSKEFSTGSFIILKTDAQVGDPKKHPCIWRIDGKALLQKYEPFEEEGKVRHKTTSIYTGWSALDIDLYAPVTVTVKDQGNHTLIVDLDWDKLKEINMDSD